MNTNLNKTQKDYALYLPAISTAYESHITKEHVPQSRMPQSIQKMEQLNFFKQQGLFQYNYGLYSAGHAQLNLTKVPAGTDMIRDRPKGTFLIGDSGGYQIGTGAWKADWANPKCPRALKYRQKTFTWLNSISDYSMSLDIPVWTSDHPKGGKNANINSYQDAVDATDINHRYFIKHSDKESRFLNVLQGRTHTEAIDWYNTMKHYSDKSKHEYPFRGWGFGGVLMGDIHMTLKIICYLMDDNLLTEGENDCIHVLGTSKLLWAVMLTDIQRAIRKYYNPKLTISFDSASPFLTTANGQMYYGATNTKIIAKSIIDDKTLTKDTRYIRDALTGFNDSPITEHLRVNDLCKYTSTCTNKNGKIGKTSWDTFSYVLIMGHNTWTLINAVQKANEAYDNGDIPDMLINNITGLTFRSIVDEVFSTNDLKTQLNILDKHSSFFNTITGNRGSGGKNSVNATTHFNILFGE